MDVQTISRKQLLAVPEPIRLWMGSEETVDNLIKIRKLFGIPDEKRTILPSLLAALEVKVLPPGSFVDKIKEELSVDEGMAQKIAVQIKSLILTPIANDLKAGGIDISAIPGDSKTETEQEKSEAEELAIKEEPKSTPAPETPPAELKPPSSQAVDLKASTPPAPAPAPEPQKAPVAPPSQDKKETPTEGPAPFMVQQNRSPDTTGDTSGFKLKLDEELLKKLSPLKKEPENVPSPKTARLEIGTQENTPKDTVSRTPENKTRVVHYNQFKTPLSPQKENGDKIPDAPTPPAPASFPSTANTKRQVPLTPNPLFDKESPPSPGNKTPEPPKPPMPPAPKQEMKQENENGGGMIDLQSFDS